MDINNLQIVPEEIFRYCAEVMGLEDNNFSNCLKVADEFREAGLTPVFLCSYDLKNIGVTTKEKITKKMH